MNWHAAMAVFGFHNGLRELVQAAFPDIRAEFILIICTRGVEPMAPQPPSQTVWSPFELRRLQLVVVEAPAISPEEMP